MTQQLPADPENLRELLKRHDESDEERREVLINLFRNVLRDPAQTHLPVDIRHRMKVLVDASNIRNEARVAAVRRAQAAPPPPKSEVPSAPPQQPIKATEETRREEQVPRATQTRRVRRYVIERPPEPDPPALAVPAPPRPLSAEEERSQTPVVLRFALQVVVGIFAFSIVAVAAAALSLLVHRVEARGVSPYIALGLQAVELLIFGADILVVTIFVVVEALSLIRLLVDDGWKAIRPRRDR